MTPFIQMQKHKQLLMKVILMMYLSQFILQLYQIHKRFQEKVQAGLLIKSQIIIKYNPLVVSSYIELAKELDHPRKGLVNLQNVDDNECFKQCLVKCLNPAHHRRARITKADKILPKSLALMIKTFQSKLKIYTKMKK